MNKTNKTQDVRFTNTEAILESISDGVFTVDKDWRVTSFNRSAEEITGISRKEAIGRRCSEVFRASMCEIDCALQHTLDTGRPVINRSAFIIDADGMRIPISVSTALLRDENGMVAGGAETFRDLSLENELRKELKERYQVGDFITRSLSMGRILEILPVIADSESTVLIQGATGTGKELLARAIHDLSRRKDKPFVAVNCGSLPDTLLESELFGYKTGAFTGAVKDKPGRFARAEGGTLFLDEIGDISQAMQVRLLRVLQEKTYEPLGGTKPVIADTRIVAATNRDLTAQMKEGSFREDLFYRINVTRIDLPPLRERKEDIPLLVDHFILRFNRLQGKSLTGISAEAISFLMDNDWPGNVRELENLIERAFVLSSTGQIERHHLTEGHAMPGPLIEKRATIDATMKAVEAQTIGNALKRNHNNRLAAARELGIHKTTLFRKMKALGIPFPEQDGRFRNRNK